MSIAKYKTLFGRTYAHMKQFWQPIFLGAIVLGTIAASAQHVANNALLLRMSNSLVGFGIAPVKLQDLQQKIKNGDEAAMDEFLVEMQKAQQMLATMPPMQKEEYSQQQAIKAFKAALPTVMISILILGCISYVSLQYFLVQAVLSTATQGATVKVLLRKFFPLLGLSVWVFLRSLGWIPIIGPFLSLYFMPRFALSGVIMLDEKMGPIESVRQSYARSRGYWWTILKDSYLAALCTMAVYTFSWFALSFALQPNSLAMLVIFGFICQCGMAFMMVFITQLSREIMKYPKAEAV